MNPPRPGSEAQLLATRRQLLVTEAAMQRMRLTHKVRVLRTGSGALQAGLRLWSDLRDHPSRTVLPVIGALALWQPAWRDRLVAGLLLWRLGALLRDRRDRPGDA